LPSALAHGGLVRPFPGELPDPPPLLDHGLDRRAHHLGGRALPAAVASCLQALDGLLYHRQPPPVHLNLRSGERGEVLQTGELST
jgi:hypothetical protein